MPERGSHQDSPFLFVGLTDHGQVECINVFFSKPADAKRAAGARALIHGAKKFQVYRISRSKGDSLEFERMK